MTCWSILAGVLGQDFSTKPNRRTNHVRPGALIFFAHLRPDGKNKLKPPSREETYGFWGYVSLKLFSFQWNETFFTALHLCPCIFVHTAPRYCMRWGKTSNQKKGHYYYYSSCSQRCWLGLWKGSMGELNCSYRQMDTIAFYIYMYTHIHWQCAGLPELLTPARTQHCCQRGSRPTARRWASDSSVLRGRCRWCTLEWKKRWQSGFLSVASHRLYANTVDVALTSSGKQVPLQQAEAIPPLLLHHLS